MQRKEIQRGDLFYYDFGKREGSVQSGERPVMVIQADNFTGESQRADGTYHYSWTDANRKRRYVYAKTLDELRYKEEQIEKDKKDGIKAEAR